MGEPVPSVTPVPGSAEGWPSVSVVVPTRNRPGPLHRAVRSILEQRYPGKVECIVVFDRTEPRLPDLPVPPGRSLRSTVNSRTPGLAGTRNSGAAVATGELLAHCDDDDEWLPTKLHRQVTLLRRYPDAVAVGTGIYVAYGDRRILRNPQKQVLTFDDFLLSRNMEINCSNLLFRLADFHGRVGPVDEALPDSYSEDYEWLLRASRVGPVVGVLEPLAVIHWGHASWFQTRWRSVEAGLRYILERYPEFERQPKGHARVLGQIAFALAAGGQRKEARKWARKCLSASWTERRAYLAYAVSLGLVSADTLMHLARRTGRGI